MKTKVRKITLSLFIISLFVLASCVMPQQAPVVKVPRGDYQQPTTLDLGSDTKQATQEFIKFNNINEVATFLQRQQQSGGYDDFSSPVAVRSMSADMAVAESAVMGAPMAKSAPQASDYSTTNIQVENVDEADYVKNDGQYIYMIADNKLIIIDAYDAKNAKIISETKVSNDEDEHYRRARAKELFINKDTLALFVEKDEESYYFERYDIEPRQSYRQHTVVYVFDISDRSNPKIKEKFQSTGRYYQSRLIGDIVYLVTQEHTNQGIALNEPVIRATSQRIAPDIYYFDNPEQNYQFNTISSIDLGSNKVIDAKTLMMGYANTLMVSQDNIYIAYQKQDYWRWGWHNNRYDKERFTKVVVPLLRLPLQNQVKAILNNNKPEAEQWQEISKVFAQLYQQMDNDELVYEEYEQMMEDIVEALEEYDTKKALENRKTIVQKLSINNGNIEHVAKGEVYGNLLNQFSLDEHNGNLRLATTVDVWAKKRVQHNNVYVLDENMKQIGEITGIAEDERIYSARFMGDRLYMVTFKQVDPFFVIDLSNPTAPKVLGELKIPGFSNYLHPYDENHVIGIGKETQETKWGGFTTQGIKIAMFDVSDVRNPKEKQKLEIGDQGSDSAALHDHKAFLFDKEKELLVLPVTKVTKKEKLSEYRWSNRVWTGAYVFHIDESGFEVTGKVKHGEKKSDYFSWNYPATVKRSLYMDDNLYTISDEFVKINDMSSDLDELNSIRLPGHKDKLAEPRPMQIEPVMIEPEVMMVE